MVATHTLNCSTTLLRALQLPPQSRAIIVSMLLSMKGGKRFSWAFGDSEALICDVITDKGPAQVCWLLPSHIDHGL